MTDTETITEPIDGMVRDYEFVDVGELIVTVEDIEGVTYKETFEFVEAVRVEP